MRDSIPASCAIAGGWRRVCGQHQNCKFPVLAMVQQRETRGMFPTTQDGELTLSESEANNCDLHSYNEDGDDPDFSQLTNSKSNANPQQMFAVVSPVQADEPMLATKEIGECYLCTPKCVCCLSWIWKEKKPQNISF